MCNRADCQNHKIGRRDTIATDEFAKEQDLAHEGLKPGKDVRVFMPTDRSVARQHADWLSLMEVSGPFLSMPVPDPKVFLKAWM